MKKIIALMFFFLFLYSEDLSNISVGNNFICPTPSFTGNKFFVCPKLDNNHISYLTKINEYSYICEYYDKNNYHLDLSCSYNSVPLAKDLNKSISELNFNLYPTLIESLKNQSTYINNVALLSNSDFEKINNFYAKLKAIQEGNLNGMPEQLKTISNIIQNYFVGNIKNLNIEKRHYTFAEFLGKIITLNENVIKSIDPATLGLVISSEWKTKLTSSNFIALENNVWTQVKEAIKHAPFIPAWVKGFLTKIGILNTQNQNQGVSIPADNSSFKIASLTDFLKNPIWGYYYLLMSYFDYLISKIIVLMLISIGAYISVVSATKTFIQSKLNPQGEFGGHNQSLKYTKLITIMSLVTFFLLSPVSKITNGNNEGITFYTNDTIAKNVIRKVVDMGDFAGTLTNDVGLSAYLTYFARKEGIITNVKDFKISADNSIKNLLYVKYESALLSDCMKMYNKNKIQDFFVEMNNQDVLPPANNNVLLNYTQADRISYGLCQSIAQDLIQIPRDVRDKINYLATTLNNLTDTNNGKKINAIKSTMFIMSLINDKLGWVSVMNVPVTDNLMKITSFYSLLFKNQENPYQADNEKTIEDFFKINSNKVNISNSGGIKEGVMHITGILAIYSVMPGFMDIFSMTKTFLSTAIYGGINSISNVISAIAEKIPAGKAIILGAKILSWLHGKKDKKKKNVEKAKSLLDVIILVIAFYLAVLLWKLSVNTIFSVIIALILLFKILFYYKDVLMYFVTSIFVPLLAFSRDVNARVNRFLLEGLYLAVYPTILVAFAYIFIFAVELFDFLYDVIFKAFAQTEIGIVRIMTDVSSGGLSGFANDLKAFFVSESIITAGDAIAIFFKILIAYFILFKGVSWVLSKLGFNDLASTESMSEQFIERGMRNVNPIV